MTDDVASASVSITPDLSGFKDRLESSLEADTADGATVTVETVLDDTATKAELDEIGAKRETVTVDTNYDNFSVQPLDDLVAAMDRVGVESDSFTSRMQDAGVSEEDLAGLASQTGISLDDLVNHLDFADQSSKALRTDFDGLKFSASDLGDEVLQSGVSVATLEDHLRELGTGGFDPLKDDTEQTVLGLSDVVDHLTGLGLASTNAGGDLLDMNGKVTTSNSVLKDLGIVMDQGTISSQGLNDSIKRFAEDGLVDASGNVEHLGQDMLDSNAKSSQYSAGMSAAEDATRAFSSGMQAASGAATGLSTAAGSAGSGGSEMGTVFDALPDAISPATVGVAALATALIPIAGVATGAGIALAGAFAAGLAGVGAFALAASGDFTNFTNTLSSEVSEWQTQLQSWVQPVVNDLTTLIAPALNSIAPLVESASTAIGASVRSIGDALNSGGLHDFISFLTAQAPAAIDTFTALLENMGQGFASVVEAFAPFISTIEAGLVNLSGKFADLGSSSGLKSFVSYVEQEGPVVGAFFEAIGPSVEKLVAAFAPLGDAVIRVLTPIITDFGNMAPVIQLAAGAVDLLARAIEAVLTPLEEASKIAGDVANFFGSLAKSVLGVGSSSDTASKSTTQLTAALEKSGLSANQAQALIAQYGSTNVSAMGASKAAAEDFGNQLGITGQQFSDLEQSSGQSGSKLVSALQKAADAAGLTASAMVNVALASGTSFTAMSKDIASAESATSSSFDSATSAVGHFSGQLSVTGGDISDFYSSTVSQSQGFAANIQKAIEDGYNPQLIEQILQAGSQAAGGFLQGLVSNGSQAFVAQINQASSALSTIGQEAIQEARITQEAISAQSGAFAAESAGALAEQQAAFAVAAGEPVSQAIAALNAQYPNWLKDAQDYGNAIPSAFLQNGPAASAAAGAQGDAVSGGLLQGLVATANAADQQALALPTAVNQQTAAAANAAVAQAGGVTNAQVSELAKTAAASMQQALALPTAVNQQTATAAANALAQAQTVPDSQIAKLAATAASADQQALALPTAVNQQTAAAANAALQQALTVPNSQNAQLPATQAASAAHAAALPDSIFGRIQDTFNNAVSQATGVGTGFNQASIGVFGAASALSSGAWNRLQIGGTEGIGAAAAQGIADGLNAGAGAVESAAQSIANNVSNTIKTALQTKSPSRVTMEIGQFVAQGLAVGMESTVPLVEGSAKSLANAALSGLAGANPSVASSLGVSIGDITAGAFDSVSAATSRPVQITQTNHFYGDASNIPQQLASSNADLVDSLAVALGSSMIR